MWKLAVFALASPALFAQQQAQQQGGYTPGLDSQAHEGVPKGVVTSYRLEPGKYYPGTPHSYAVYVPAQYNAAKPTAFMIFMDGRTGGRTPVVFDNLIAKGDIPPMIGIFVDPGILLALRDSAQDRRERIFEYDNISDRYSKFLLEELIPEVEKKYNLSHSPDDRALCGTSTGAVAAFTAAWHRPDQFHRVLSFIGTYVSMKGADAFPAMIRRTEPKPLRILLQDGKNDHIMPGQEYGTFYAGSWPINNQLMYEALQFAGYDVKLDIGTGGHDGGQAGAMMPDYLRWLWRDYPKPITVHEPQLTSKAADWSRGQVYAVISADKPWEEVGTAHQFLTAPAVDKDGNAYYADRTRIYKADPAGKETVFREGTAGLGVMKIGADGRLYASAASPAKVGIVSFGSGGDQKKIADVAATDFAITAGGDIYYVDGHTIGHIDQKGTEQKFTSSDLSHLTAIALSTDQAMLIVGDAASRYSWSFQIGANGMPINGEPFFRLDIPEMASGCGVVGITVDSINQPYFTDALGIQSCEQNGRCGATYLKPALGTMTGMAFTSARDVNYMYAAVDGQMYRRPTRRGGVDVASRVKPPNPPL